jgi:hypothetical protein
MGIGCGISDVQPQHKYARDHTSQVGRVETGTQRTLLESRQIRLSVMSAFFNVGRWDRVLRLVLGIGLGVSAILLDGHPYARWGLTLGGIAVILSGTCGI